MDPDLKRILDMSYGFAAIERDIYYPSRQRPENDAEHGYQLAVLAWQIIEKDRLPLDVAKVFKLCLAHDLVELYAGDVPLWGKSGHEGKQEREAKALERIRAELGADHDIPATIAEYKVRETEEAKFVYGLDKLAPFLNQLNTEGKVWKAHGVTMERAEEMLEKQALAAPELTKYFKAAIAHMKENRKRFFGGFTLIELLVVISIISLLASVVLASLNTARDKGRIAAVRQFETNIYHAAGDEAVGIWDFNECSGGTLYDRSSNGNNAAQNGTAIWSTTDVPYGTNCSLSFNASYSMRLSSASVADFSNNQPFTLSLWVKKTVWGNNETFISTAGYISGGYAFATGYSNGEIYFFNENSPSVNSIISAPAGTLQLNVWTHLAAIYDGTSGSIYKDGKRVAYAAMASPGPNVVPLRMGWASQGGWTNLANANMTDVRIFAKALTATEIGKLYAAGAATLKVAENGRVL